MNTKLRAAREASGKTQAQVAKEIGITENAYQKYEYGEREPRARMAARVAKAVNSSVEAIWGEDSLAGNPKEREESHVQ